MNKAHFHAQISKKAKQACALFTALGLTLLALLDYLQGYSLTATLTVIFTSILLMYWAYLNWQPPHLNCLWPEYLLIGSLIALTFFAIDQHQPIVYWVYLTPIYCYLFLPWRTANLVLPLYSIAVFTLILTFFDEGLRTQLIFTYLACAGFSFLYALINQRNNSRLEAIINSDPISRVYNQTQLMEELNKEMLRADRQNSALMLLIVTLPTGWKALKGFKLDHKLILLSQTLRRSLRGFDTCYRLDSDDLVILMPQASSAQVELLLQKLTKEFKQNYSSVNMPTIAIEHYRPEDDVLSLMSRIGINMTGGNEYAH